MSQSSTTPIPPPTKTMPADRPANPNSTRIGAPFNQVTDGRLHRSIATRRRIVTALEELIRAGVLSPTAEQVAQRADVGLRTVFRHFDDMETLYREINVDLEAISMPALKMRLQSPTWEDRLMESIALRAQLFEKLMPYYVSACVHRHHSKFIEEQHARDVKAQRAVLEKILAVKLLDRCWQIEALDLLLSIDSWVRLRREQGLTPERAIEVMRGSARACLGAETMKSKARKD